MAVCVNAYGYSYGLYIRLGSVGDTRGGGAPFNMPVLVATVGKRGVKMIGPPGVFAVRSCGMVNGGAHIRGASERKCKFKMLAACEQIIQRMFNKDYLKINYSKLILS